MVQNAIKAGIANAPATEGELYEKTGVLIGQLEDFTAFLLDYSANPRDAHEHMEEATAFVVPVQIARPNEQLLTDATATAAAEVTDNTRRLLLWCGVPLCVVVATLLAFLVHYVTTNDQATSERRALADCNTALSVYAVTGRVLDAQMSQCPQNIQELIKEHGTP